MRKDNSAPLSVQIPETGEYIDMRPLINLIGYEAMPTTAESIKAIVDSIENIIRTLNVNCIFDASDSPDYAQQQIVFHRLYKLKDLFEGLTVIK